MTFSKPAFAAPALLAGPRNTVRPHAATMPRRPVRMMASNVRPNAKDPIFSAADLEDDAPPVVPPEAPEVAAVAASVCEFMNKEHVRDIANYIVRFGRQFDDLSQLTAVKMTGLDAAGFTTDIVSCDESSHCVCVQERLDWPLGLCTNAHDVINALKHLSMACGLPADF